jgi:phospholipid:diacylglycerol acyltransferase
MIENLAALGYDGNSMAMMAYDWRLSFHNLEIRDKLFSKMQITVELLVEARGEKAVVLAHSLGTNLWMAFMSWVTSTSRSGQGDPSWVERHIHSVVNLGGPLLGAVGPLTALLSGEAHMGPLGMLTDRLMNLVLGETGRLKVRDVFRTWGGLYELLPTGGDAVWGSHSDPTDCSCDMLTRENAAPLNAEGAVAFLRNLSMQDADSSNASSRRVAASVGPLDMPLPHASGLRIFCMYGVALQTERGYHYKRDATSDLTDWQIDYSQSHGGSSPSYYAEGAYSQRPVEYGRVVGDGDGTVPLVSLGYMCQSGWRHLRALNPGSAETTVREYVDRSVSVLQDRSGRGGDGSAKHVEMLGNSEIIGDVLHIAAGNDSHLLRDRVASRIGEISKRVTERVLISQPELGVPHRTVGVVMR